MNWNDVYARGLRKVTYMFNDLKGQFPHITKEGHWLSTDTGHWTGGFWVGLLWMHGLYPERGEQRMSLALDQALKLKSRSEDNKTHDMGFIFGPSCVWGSRLTGSSQLRDLAIKSATNLRHLYDPVSNAIYAWDEKDYQGVSIVDTIMNLPILIWASKEVNQPGLEDMAIKVADQIATNHIRKDGSTWHVVRWDPEAHEIVEKGTHQGYSKDSCWSRGHAWALYGFANMYRYSGKEQYLATAQKLADYFWNHIDEKDYLPKWDFNFKDDENEPIDAAAGSIAASGMVLLSEQLKKINRDASKKWRERGEHLLEALVKNCFYFRTDEYGIIQGVTVDKPHNSGINESSMYGDYYFMEALYRLLNEGKPEVLDLLY